MTGPAPLAHLVAEAAAFPLTAPIAWTARVVALTRASAGGDPTSLSSQLTQPLAEHLRLRARGMNEEILRHVRDRAWFPQLQSRVSLADHVTQLADCYLVLRGDAVTLRADVEHAPFDDGGSHDMTSRALRWRWISLALPADLLVAACAASAGYDDPPREHVLLATPVLEKILDKGCAETHMHVSAATPFTALWTAWMVDAPRGPQLPKDGPFGGGASLEAMLTAASVARLAMLWFLRDRRPDTAFADYLQQPLRDRIIQYAWHHDPERLRRIIVGLCRRVMGLPSPEGAAAARLVLSRANPNTWRLLRRDVIARDPLTRWLAPLDGVGLPEGRLVARALRYLRSRDDQGFAALFWQYQRVRCQMYRYLVEEPGTAGLDWFTRFQKRISPLRKPLANSKYAQALATQSQGLTLGALEARTSPSAKWFEVRDEARAYAKQALHHQNHTLPEGEAPPEVGLILHFIKDRDAALKRDRVARPNADPTHTPAGARFAHWFRGRQFEAAAIANALRRFPELLAILRGIDVANLEMSTPAWVLAPLFARVRDAAARASRRLGVTRPRWRVPGIRVTVHAGEDYRRLMEGLRRMHECVEAGLLRSGDRIGHGLAIGVDIDRYAQTHPLVLQPAEERLDDLLWELDRHRAGEACFASSRSEYVRAQIDALAREIYAPDAPSAEHLCLARRLRFSPSALDALGYPMKTLKQPPSDLRTPLGLLYRHLTDAGVYARGQRGVEVRVTDGERSALKTAQELVQKSLARLEVTIECNPTSNLLIGDIGVLQTHPAFRLVPIEQATPRFGVPVSVNTDNPVTFGSCLGDEFAVLYHALLMQGAGATQAVAWIDAARDAGMRSRFTLAATRAPSTLKAI